MFRLGLKRPIVDCDVYRTIKSHESKSLTDDFEEQWNQEKIGKNPKLLNKFAKIYGKRVIAVSVVYTILEIARRLVYIAIYSHSETQAPATTYFILVFLFECVSLSHVCILERFKHNV